MELKNNKFAFLILYIFFLFGLTIGLIVGDVKYLSFDKQLSIGDLANLFLALFIAIGVPFYLDKFINNKRKEKDILIEECNNFNKEIYDFGRLVESALIQQNKYKKINKENANNIILRIQHIGKILKMLTDNIVFYIGNGETKNIQEQLISNHSGYWSDITVNLRDKKPVIKNQVSSEKKLYAYYGNILKLKLILNKS